MSKTMLVQHRPTLVAKRSAKCWVQQCWMMLAQHVWPGLYETAIRLFLQPGPFRETRRKMIVHFDSLKARLFKGAFD